MPFAGVIAQAQPAHAKTAVKSPCPAAKRATVILAHFELIRPFSFDAKTGLGQFISPSGLAREWHAHESEQSSTFLIRFRRGSDCNRHTAGLFDFVGLNLGKHDLLAQAQ